MATVSITTVSEISKEGYTHSNQPSLDISLTVGGPTRQCVMLSAVVY